VGIGISCRGAVNGTVPGGRGATTVPRSVVVTASLAADVQQEEDTMVERISPRQFHESVGVEDWHVLFFGASTFFPTASFAQGAELVGAIGRLADDVGSAPAVDLRRAGVTVSVFSPEVSEISDRDAALARRISEVAAELGVRADPSRVQWVQISIDALDIPRLLPFWCAVLGYERFGDEDAVDPLGQGPNVTFQQMDEPRPQRNRIHLDLSVPRAQAQERIEAALRAGGRLVTDEFAPHWWTLADPKGNEVDVAPWRDPGD